jgi:hypothetical protein
LNCKQNVAVIGDAKHIIENFESLADQERIEVLAEIIRLARDIESPELTRLRLRPTRCSGVS